MRAGLSRRFAKPSAPRYYPTNMPRLKAPQRREQLMEVATKLFARNGYEATTTAAIAEMAGVTEPILYRHFKSKQELFVAIVKAVSDRTLRHWEELIKGIDDPAEQIRRVAWRCRSTWKSWPTRITCCTARWRPAGTRRCWPS